VTVGDVITAIERLAPTPLAYDWDRPGLAIGSRDAKVSGVLTALGVNPAAVKAAKRANANLIVSHHPVIWSPLKALRTDDPHTAMCLDLAQSGIACYSAHTNLDVVPGGVNAVLAKTLGFKETAPLFPVEQAAQCKLVTFVPPDYLAKVRDAMCEAGAGIIGDYTYCSFSSEGTGTFLPGGQSNPFAGRVGELAEENERKLEVIVLEARVPAVVTALYESHPYEEPAYDLLMLKNRDDAIALGLRGELPRAVQLDTFASQVRQRLDVSHVRVIGDGKRSVKRVAMLGGSGRQLRRATARGGGRVRDRRREVSRSGTGCVARHNRDRRGARRDGEMHCARAGRLPQGLLQRPQRQTLRRTGLLSRGEPIDDRRNSHPHVGFARSDQTNRRGHRPIRPAGNRLRIARRLGRGQDLFRARARARCGRGTRRAQSHLYDRE
jgi:dinuclear metal center YbgI/SA1388 family protein